MLLVNSPKLFRKILPIYWAFLTYILLRPTSGEILDHWFIFSEIDKIAHFLTFFLLGALLRLAYPSQKFSRYIMIILIYGLLTEILQDELAFGRTLDALDLLADTLGGGLAYYIIYKLKK
ncbi:VanZ family protein [Riemerella columbina]|uniref:VanZ family protein n=1 Tax=Riemerella columbina TaxID=103810 RepID=UPI00266EA988|nr:VanZ family protein [Riemerella columbina]WKS94875.1 VanZ family protein [Riemerella columbina]